MFPAKGSLRERASKTDVSGRCSNVDSEFAWRDDPCLLDDTNAKFEIVQDAEQTETYSHIEMSLRVKASVILFDTSCFIAVLSKPLRTFGGSSAAEGKAR